MTSLVVHFCSAPLVCFVDALDSQDSVDPNDTADHQWERLQAATQGEDVQIVMYHDNRD